MKSRFLNVSPRAYIRQTDSVNVLPPIVRTGYQREMGVTSSAFIENDNTIVFGDNNSLMAPYMLPTAFAQRSGFLTGTLVLTATLQSSTAYLQKAVTNPPGEPFIEGSNPSGYFNLDGENLGFIESVYPGFSSETSDKIAITFDLTNTVTQNVYKLNRFQSQRDINGEFYNNPGSGFVYYNASTKRWTDIGVRDNSTLALKQYNPSLRMPDSSLTTAGYYSINGRDSEYMCQFSSSPYSIAAEGTNYVPKDRSALKARGYDRIGDPTSFFGAPNAPRYHAPYDHTFKMSDYISQPLVLDRISLKIPITFLRTQIPYTGSVTTDAGFGRDIDNYVFFVYVQNRSNATKDSKQDVSSSIRYLIANKSFCAYNRDTLNLVQTGQLPIHDHGKAVKFEFLKDEATTSGSATRKTKTEEINMSFRPRTYTSTFGALSKLPSDGFVSATSSRVTGSVFVSHFWKGGQFASGSLGTISRVDNTTNLNVRSGSILGNQDSSLLAIASPRALVDSHWKGTSEMISSGSGIGTAGFEPQTVSVERAFVDTPVVIFPGDEIIFGIESGVNSNFLTPGRLYGGLDYDVLEVTGSRIQIRTGDAKVVFYGSLISEGVEKFPSLNQYLGSDAIHEDIHEEGPYDQFDILPRSCLSGSYVDNIFLGLAGKNRRVVARGSLGQGWITGSLQRNVRHTSATDIYYDALVPAPSIISSSLENTTTELIGATEKSLGIRETQIIKVITDSSNGFAFNNNREGGVMLKRAFTFEYSLPNDRRVKNIQMNLYSVVPALITTQTGDRAKYSIYYNGTNPAFGSAGNENYSGAGSLRYGLLSTRAVGPSNVFRRDRFGQFRDMLEQSRDGKVLSEKKQKSVLSSGVVVAKFVSGSSDIETDGIFTQCSNISIECTSSIPYTDLVARNRGTPPSSYKVKVGARNLLFGVTGSFGAQ